MATTTQDAAPRGGPDYVAAAKEAALAALVMAVLAVPLIGFVLVDVTGGVTLKTRFGGVAAAAAIVFVGRFALALLSGRGTSLGLGAISGVVGRLSGAGVG
ncbi:MAG: DUF3382 domain-containing protein, partial [Rhodospirillales bacterium]